MEIIATYREREERYKERRRERERWKNWRIVRQSRWLSSVCIAYSTLPRSKCKSKCLCVPGKSVQMAWGGGGGAKAGVKLALGVGGDGAGSFRRLQISKMHTDLVHPLPSRRG